MASLNYEELFSAADALSSKLKCVTYGQGGFHKTNLGLFGPGECPVCRARDALDAVADAEQVDPEDRVGVLDLAIDEMKEAR